MRKEKIQLCSLLVKTFSFGLNLLGIKTQAEFMNYFGLVVKTSLNLFDFKIIISEDTIAIIINLGMQKTPLIDFFLAFKEIYNFKTDEINSIFGLFHSTDYFLIKKKMKITFVKDLNINNFIYILEGDNSDSYYNNIHDADKIIGIEIRFNCNIYKNTDWEQTLLSMQKNILNNRKKIIQQH